MNPTTFARNCAIIATKPPFSIGLLILWACGLPIGLASGPATAYGQGGPVIDLRNVGAIENYSYVYIPLPPPPPEIKVHDIITVEVDEKAEVIVNSRFNRQRNGAYELRLSEFIRLRTNDLRLDTTNATEPGIEGTLQNRLQTIGTSTDQEGITYKIAATVVDVLPNGTIVLEARKSIRTNQDFFEYRLTGRIDQSAISPRRTARTEDIAELQIERKQRGKVFDSTKVNWLNQVMDRVGPF